MNKVLVISNSTAGLQNFREELIVKLSKSYDLHICAPIDTDFKYNNVTYHDIKLDRRGKNIVKEFNLYREYKKTIKSIEPDIILSYTIKPNIYAGLIARKYKIPYIPNITGLGNVFYESGLLKRIIIILYKRAFKKAHHVFFQNEYNKEVFTQHKIVASNSCSIIPGSGVNLSKFKPLPYKNNEHITITYLGRVMKEKGVMDLLNAIDQLNLSTVTINLVGTVIDKEIEEKLNELVKENKVSYYKRVSDVIPILKDSDAIINPSYHEGMSNVLLEAASSARPVLASNIPGCKETFDEGISGIGFEPKDVDSLLEAINEFILLSHEERKEMGLRGREKMENEFDRNIVINKYIKKIDEILKENI